MSRPPKIRPLPERERRDTLAAFLDVLDRDPELAHFRALVPAEQRKLALLAALERSALRGNAALCPPAVHDVADQLLCDILDAIGRDPRTKDFGCAYGSDQRRANLQALGEWHDPPRHGELFATAFVHLNSAAASTWPASEVNCSPAPQVPGPFGELIGPENGSAATLTVAAESPQFVVSLELTPSQECGQPALEVVQPAGIIRHEAAESGEQSPAVHALEIPARPLRRGRKSALDDVAKGRLLGLMSYGLSFRQAAAQLGVHHQTLLNLMKRDEEFSQQVAEARLDAISQPLLTVVQASRKNWRAAAWLAKFLNDRRTSGYESTPEEREVEWKRKQA